MPPSRNERTWRRIDRINTAAKADKSESSWRPPTRFEQEALRHPSKETRAAADALDAKIREENAAAAKAALLAKSEEEKEFEALDMAMREAADIAKAFGGMHLI